MIRRLAAAFLLILGLAGCDGGSKPAPAPAPSKQAPPAIEAHYKATPSKVLNAVRKRGYVACGVNPGLPGFAYPDVHGVWRGFDVDFCRAVAAAVLGDASKVRFTPIPGPGTGSARSRRARSISCRATPPGRSRATQALPWTSRQRLISTARGSWRPRPWD